MFAKDALVKIGKLSCGLEDTYAYYSEHELITGFKKTCAFQPRVIKANCGVSGQGIWLCWLWDKETKRQLEIYPSKSLGECSLGDHDYLKLMEMNDNHVEYHTVKEFMIFCVRGPDAPGAGTWKSSFKGKCLDGGHIVDQRLLPRADEGVVRLVYAGDKCEQVIHNKPMGGGLSPVPWSKSPWVVATVGNSKGTYYQPTDPKYAGLVQKMYAEQRSLQRSLGAGAQPLPPKWTCDICIKNDDSWAKGPYDRSCPDSSSEYTVIGFNL